MTTPKPVLRTIEGNKTGIFTESPETAIVLFVAEVIRCDPVYLSHDFFPFVVKCPV